MKGTRRHRQLVLKTASDVHDGVQRNPRQLRKIRGLLHHGVASIRLNELFDTWLLCDVCGRVPVWKEADLSETASAKLPYLKCRSEKAGRAVVVAAARPGGQLLASGSGDVRRAL